MVHANRESKYLFSVSLLFFTALYSSEEPRSGTFSLGDIFALVMPRSSVKNLLAEISTLEAHPQTDKLKEFERQTKLADLYFKVRDEHRNNAQKNKFWEYDKRAKDHKSLADKYETEAKKQKDVKVLLERQIEQITNTINQILADESIQLKSERWVLTIPHYEQLLDLTKDNDHEFYSRYQSILQNLYNVRLRNEIYRDIEELDQNNDKEGLLIAYSALMKTTDNQTFIDKQKKKIANIQRQMKQEQIEETLDSILHQEVPKMDRYMTAIEYCHSLLEANKDNPEECTFFTDKIATYKQHMLLEELKADKKAHKEILELFFVSLEKETDQDFENNQNVLNTMKQTVVAAKQAVFVKCEQTIVAFEKMVEEVQAQVTDADKAKYSSEAERSAALANAVYDKVLFYRTYYPKKYAKEIAEDTRRSRLLAFQAIGKDPNISGKIYPVILN